MDMFAEMLCKGGLSLDRLNNFCRIAKAGGINKAAGGDPGKQSLYSRQIKELETFFGVELKVRRGKGIVLTDAGHQLAQLARAHLIGLVDFQRTAKSMPQTISIGSGNSVIEWILAPRMGALRQALPQAQFEFFADRTRVIVSRLQDLTLDVGIVREEALRKPLKSIPLTRVTFSLFVPKKLSPGVNAKNFRTRIGEIPLATSMGGTFRDTLESGAAESGWSLKVTMSCSSFTQAARLMRSGICAGVLPDIASVEFDPTRVLEFPLPFLRNYSRKLCVAWNPRTVEVRANVARAVKAIKDQFFTGTGAV